MKDRKQRNIIIGTLCCLLVFMGIGYAILSANLNILGKSTFVGTWNIVMTNISVVSEGQATGTYSDLSTDNQNATLSVDLYKPMDKVTYTVTVENQGTIDASLKAVNLLPVSNHEYVEAITTAKVGTALLAGDSTTFDVTIRFKNIDITSLPSDVTVQYDLSLTFMQYTENTFVKGETLSDNSSFMISKSGKIISYDNKDGNYVTVPSSIDGIEVTGINMLALYSGNVIVYFEDPGATLVSGGSAASTGFIIKDEENYETIRNFLYQRYGEVDSDTGETYGYYHMGEVVLDNPPTTSNEYFDIETNKFIELQGLVEYLNLSQTNITTINNYAFNGYTALKEVILPDSLQIINRYAFKGTSLKEITLPDGLVSIGDSAFNNTLLTEVVIPASVTSIGDLAFNSNPNLTKIIFKGRTSTAGMTLGTNWKPSTAEIVFEEN